jgi:DNA-binding transcriptional ArsR family regulator/rhodanese-related sulfurtransferase
MAADSHRLFKDRLFAQFARIGKALGNPRRLELLDLLAQSERSVDALATETGLSLANASQHLQALRRASLVETRRDGLFVYYRLADPAVFDLFIALRTTSERRLADLERLVHEHFGDRSKPEPVGMRELLNRIRSNDVIVLDARPANEFEAGHIAGAISVPIDTLQQRLRRLPRDREYVAYCRGPYCVYADRAVEQLRASRRRARRLLEGFPEWRAAGLPIARGRDGATPPRRVRVLRAKQQRGSSAKGES